MAKLGLKVNEGTRLNGYETPRRIPMSTCLRKQVLKASSMAGTKSLSQRLLGKGVIGPVNCGFMEGLPRFDRIGYTGQRVVEFLNRQ